MSRRTCKPNSVSRRGGTTVIPLGRASLRDSSDLPGSGGASSRNARRISSPLLPYLVLLRVGFALPWLLPARRCALTAPFHPYPPRRAVCFLWHFPSSGLESTLPGVTWHIALRSSDFPRASFFRGLRNAACAAASSSRLARARQLSPSAHPTMPATVRSSCYC